MAQQTQSPFNKLQWWRLSFHLLSKKPFSVLKNHPFSIIEAILKGASSRRSIKEYSEDPHAPIFHFKNKRHNFKLNPMDQIHVEILFFQTDLASVEKWRTHFWEYLSDKKNARTFEIINLGTVETRTYSILKSEFESLPDEGEICLEFLSPFFFKPKKTKKRTDLDKSSFIRSFEKRFSRMFDTEFKYPNSTDDFNILPYYWNYSEIYHPSASQPGKIQYINGCAGPLYIKGNFKNFLPYLILGSEVHTGSKLSNSQGYYIIRPKSLPFFDKKFPHKKAVQSSIQDALERHDQALETLSKDELYPFKINEYASQLCKEISSGNYNPTPNTAFFIKNSSGEKRIIEQLSIKDLIVAQYILKTISPIFDRFFEEESIGYRKGISRKRACDLIQKAISEGFSYIIESDIEDFFPSVNLQILEKLLKDYLPTRDSQLIKILKKIINSGYILKGKCLERNKGLPLGNPLSPILANLYLDFFDEQIKTLDVRMIRYADDFIIFCKKREEAEKLLANAQNILAKLGLKLNKTKTSITDIQDGFQYLGMTFKGREGYIEPIENLKLLKKPLYITEPFVWLSLNGDSIDIRKNKKLITSLPLRRISEIMLMEKTIFSTSLLRKCIDFNIPLTVTLNTGYFITTIKPDSKKYYLTASEHSVKYQALTETEILCISKGFVTGKISNYQKLFKQRYRPGFNQILKDIQHLAKKAERAGNLNEVRGVEGWAARKLYKNLNLLIDSPSFHIRARKRKNPDRINSLLNFGYYLLFSRINATIRGMGLNPYLGYLHSPQDDYESLVSDIVELFRARIDRLIIRMINLKIITEKDFVESDRGFYMTREGVRKYLFQFETEMNKRLNRASLSLKEELYLQVYNIKNWACDKTSFAFYEWK